MSKQNIDYDVVAIGAGFSGLSLIHNMRKRGLSIHVFDKADSIGGTWSWNRYPGAATDSESYVYCLTFSEELLQEWSWSERYPGWEETQKYFRYVADKFDMHRDITLSTEILSASFEDTEGRWCLTTGAGESVYCKYFVSAMGLMSQPIVPEFKGANRFQGPLFHSSRWPREGLDYTGKRVGIIGAGATAVQMLPVVAESAAHVTLFQRTPNFVLPAVQKPIHETWNNEIKANYSSILKQCREHVFALPYNSPVNRTIADSTPEEVRQVLEEHWPRGSFSFFFETFDDLLTNPDSNRVVTEFLAEKIRDKVNDPTLAELLIPKGYPLFGKRPPLDHGYYESFNRDNVTLVDIKNREPIAEITDSGVQTTQNHFELDIIVLATGFQAYTGALEAIEIRGEHGQNLRDKWAATSGSIMGIFAAGFPNMFMVTGPHAPFANLPPVIESSVEYIANCISHMETNNYHLLSPSQEAEDAWVAHSTEVHGFTVMNEAAKTSSWLMGTNVTNKPPRVLAYVGGANAYFDRLAQSQQAGYPEVAFAS